MANTKNEPRKQEPRRKERRQKGSRREDERPRSTPAEQRDRAEDAPQPATPGGQDDDEP